MGLDLEDLGGSLRYGACLELLAGLRIEWGSHTHASDQGWAFPLSRGEFASQIQTEKLVNWFRNPDDSSPPFHFHRPWADVDSATPEERDAGEQELLRRSAFAPD